MPNCTLSVSPWTINTLSIGTPKREETSWAKVVSWPCPWLCEPVRISTVPIGLTRTSADSHKPTPAPSEPTAAAGFDIGGKADPAQHAFLCRSRLALSHALIVGELQRFVERLRVVARVIG